MVVVGTNVIIGLGLKLVGGNPSCVGATNTVSAHRRWFRVGGENSRLCSEGGRTSCAANKPVHPRGFALLLRVPFAW